MVFKFIGKIIFLNIVPFLLYVSVMFTIVYITDKYRHDFTYIMGIITGIIIGINTGIIIGITTGIITGIFIGIITGQDPMALNFMFDSITSELYQLNLLTFFMFLLLLLSFMYNNYRIRNSSSKKIRKKYLILLIAMHNGVYWYSFFYVFIIWFVIPQFRGL